MNGTRPLKLKRMERMESVEEDPLRVHVDTFRPRRSSRGENSRFPRVHHPEIPSIREGEELNFEASSRPGVMFKDRSLEDLYDIAPGYLELEAPEEYPEAICGHKKMDRSLSLPAVHGNFRLLRHINQR